MSERPGPRLASVSLDVDNLWSYLKTRGDASWRSRPTYLPDFVPIVLDLLAELDLTITFFVVGCDADRDENAEPLRALSRAGHEVGNHSYEHEPWLHRYSEARLGEELARSEEAITRLWGRRPEGFRGPGYSWSPTLLGLLAQRGYLFDASTLPTFLGPVARAYYFATARLTREEREERGALFGSWRSGWWPNRPYRWSLPEGRSLLEMPVTVFPGLRVPFHFSYLLWLSARSERLMWTYVRSALAWCRRTGTEPSFLLHPLDLLGADAAPALRFFPGMNVATARKRALLVRVLRLLGEGHRIVPMGVHARAILDRSGVRTRQAFESAAGLTPALR
jgi:hypothetical protein